MSYMDDEFYQPNLEVDPDTNVIVDFDVHVPKGNMERVFREIPAESSVGTWQKVAAMTDEILKRLSAKTYEVEKVTDTFARIKIAYPLELFEPNNIPQMLSLYAGNIYGMNSLNYLRVTDVQMPNELISSFPGPAVGPEGIYNIIGIKQGPILGTIVKPKLGSPPDIHAKTTFDSWSGVDGKSGITWVKDDEPQTDQDFCKFEDRISKVLEYADQIKSETGRQVVYAANITGSINTMMRRADFVVDHGGKCLMIDVITTGFSAVQHIREQEYGLPIHAHRAMHGALTRHPEHGIHMSVLAQMYRLAGVDAIHTGTIFGKMGTGDKKVDSEETLSSNKRLLDPDFGGLKKVIPIASGGVGVKNIGRIIDALAPHVVITAGGGIHGHPDGSAAGATAMNQAKDAALQGVIDPNKLLDWAKENGARELIRALEKESDA
ncbi:MAG: ribulose-bisphosphate carboxylase large subunit [Candidatus Heimdallarchaeota archaeon]|nr:ribulose-bisphosphate carboxylase large subunit [Candidatus Heimdallarchaeota archaeon]